LSKLLKANNIFFTLVSAAAILTGCGQETPRRNFIAKVNNTYLSKEDLQTISDSIPYNGQLRDEIIRNWINRECLYQQAVKEGILKSAEYQRIAEDSQKELAASIMLKKLYEKDASQITEKNLADYFNSHIELFRLNNTAYVLNRADFVDEDRAIRFRTTVVESNWNKAINVFRKESLKSSLNTLCDELELHPAGFMRIISELDANEVSIVMNTGDNIYSVVQLAEKYTKGTIPPFEIIKDKVKAMYMSYKKEMRFKDYLEELYSQNEIEIKK
jgi:hypothetical protein